MPPNQFRLAGVQMDVALGDTGRNLQRMQAHLETAASHGARLIVFPECALTGYCFDSLDEANSVAQSIPGPSTEVMTGMCRELQVHVIYGLLERDGDRLFNACALVGPDGLVARYRKVHLPYLGVDRFTTPGDEPFGVHAAGDVRIGMNICYDASFPESARILALQQADLIALPTNWPPGAETTAQHVPNTRALENHVFFIAVNRIGTERGFRFIGHSKICGVQGHTMAEAAHEDEAIIYADIEPESARDKHIVRVPNKHEIDRLGDRRPEMYRGIVETGSKARAGG